MSKPRRPREDAISVLISAPSRLDCNLLELALKKSPYGFQVIACACTTEGVLAALRQRVPDVAVISANLQDDGPLAGIRTVRRVRETYPELPLILLVDKAERQLVVTAFRAGVRGTIDRNESLDDLYKCIYQVRHGQVWATANELQYVLQALTSAIPLRATDAKGNNLLTNREEQVVELVAGGLTNKEIGQALHLSEHTVKNYLFLLFDKLGVSSRVELILYTMKQGEPTEKRRGDQKQVA
jgi:DNA-binding NarL/FixJ family response regulator